MPLRSDWSQARCPIARSLEVLGDPWALLVLRQAFSGVRRFDDFRDQLGVADTVLSKRLAALVDEGLLQRIPYDDDRRRRQEYVLTEAGADTLPILTALALWGERQRRHRDGQTRMEVIHRGCGAPTTTTEICSHCGEPLTVETTSWRKTWATEDLELTGAVS